MPLPLASTSAANPSEYHVETHTGLRKGSGTQSKVYIKLVGSKSSSGTILLDDGVRKVVCNTKPYQIAYARYIQYMKSSLCTFEPLSYVIHVSF